MRNGNLERVQELIRSGASVNVRCLPGDDTLLILAVSCAQKDIVLALLAAGADVNAKGVFGQTALHKACAFPSQQEERGRNAIRDIVLALLAAGADVHARDVVGCTALQYACRRQWEEVVQALIDRGSPVYEVFLNRSPLVLARGNRAISLSLLRAGASCEGLSEEEKDDLFRHACHVGDLLAVATLLKNGCSVGILSREEQEVLLRCACQKRSLFVASALLTNGCRLSTLSREEQEGLLRCACHEGDIVVAGTVLDSGCSVGTLSREEQEVLLRRAYQKRNLFVAGALLTNGCRVSTLSREEQEELLRCACHEGDIVVARNLLNSGCSLPTLSTEEQERLLRCAYQKGSLFVASALLTNGCRVSTLSREEQEALLHCACYEGDINVAGTLLKYGHNVGILSREEQERLLRCACQKGSLFVAGALLKNGCRVSTLSREEQEVLLRCACHEGDISVAGTLLKNGCSVGILSREEQEVFLHRVYRKRNLFVAGALLKNGCRVNTLSREEQEELLRCACHEGDIIVAGTLLKNGCSVDALSWEEQEELLHCACHKRSLFVAGALLTNGCRVNTLSREEQEELLCCACHEGDLLVAGTLLKNGCSVSTLSREEQEELLRCACHEGDLLVAGPLLKNGCSVIALSREEQCNLLCCACREVDKTVAQTVLKAICSASELTHRQLVQLLNPLSKEGKEWLLRGACIDGDLLVVEALIAVGCSVNCVDSTGGTPLMIAACESHEQVVKKLILAGANLAMKDENGSTALHYAAIHNHIQCGLLLAEGGASVRTKNKLSQTPLDLAKSDFQKAIKQALSFTTRKTLCIIGNAEGGKSTLIASLQAESNSFLGRIFNRFRRVDDRRKRTAGIETVPYSSHKYGEVLFFDFAGQDDYHGPHQMFMESLLSKPGVSMTLLLVIKVTETEDAILHQLHRWLTPVALMSTTASPPHVIVIGSFLDKVQSKEEATGKLMRCIVATKSDLEELSLRFVGTCFLNCRQPQSEGIDQLCGFLQDVPIPEFSATHTGYCLAWVLSQIKSSIKAQAVRLQEFSRWIEANKANLPQTISAPEEVCQDLTAAGHALYIPNSEIPSKSWLVLDLPAILHDVYGTLFAQSKEIVNEFGLLHCQHFAEFFPHMDLAMIEQLLISLEFCIPVEPSILDVDLSKLTHSKEASGWRFFPSLISTKPSQSHSKILHKQSVHCLCWQLRTSKKHSISARILQTILLRLAAHFVVKHRNEEGVQQHCCHIWWNGIAWQSTVGVDVTVHITNNRVIQVIATSEIADKLCQYLTLVVSDILSTVNRLSPKLAAAAYIVYPPDKATSPEHIIGIPPKELFPVEGIRNSVREQDGFILSLKDCDNSSNRILVPSAFGGHTPSLEDVQKLIWPQAEANQPQSPTEVKGVQALLDISSPPDMRDLDELVVTRVAANWKRLALRLGVEGCVSEIVFKNHPNDYEGACRDMLDRWLRGDRHTGEEERSWSTLLTALDRAGFAELERSLRREHFTSQ